MRLIRNVVLACAAGALLPSAASAQERVQYNIGAGLGGELATRPVATPNGMIWIGRGGLGGALETPSHGWRSPGPAAYGAHEHDMSRVYARVGSTVASFSPWETVQGSGNHSLEGARQKWLAERGYTGGVRTFVNDLYDPERHHVVDDRVVDAAGKKAVEPRATIHLPIDQPRFKSRMHVDAGTTAVPGLTRVITSQPEPVPAEAEKPATQVAAKSAE